MTSQLGMNKALSTMEHVFITSKSWRHIGGLPGMCLTCRSAGAPDVTIHGPQGCMELYEGLKGFMLLDNFSVLTHNQKDDGVFSDGAITVKEVHLKRNKQLQVMPMHPSWLIEGSPIMTEDTYDNTATAYICSFSAKPGKLNIDKCVDLGVPPGPLLGKLKLGEDVTLPNGKVVKSSEVVDSTSLPSSYLVIDVPDEEYFESFLKSSELKEISNLDTVFHFTPASVARTPEYQQWVRSLGNSVRHVAINDENEGLGLAAVASFHHKLSTIRPDMFLKLEGAEEVLDLEEDSNKKRWAIQAKPGFRIWVRPSIPSRTLDYTKIPIFDRKLANEELLEGSEIKDDEERNTYVEELGKALDYAKSYNPDPIVSIKNKLAKVDGVEISSLSTNESYPKVTFLGTGSSIPSKYRNVSGILVEISQGKYLIMDCGEGTISQMTRMFGAEGLSKVLMGLSGVYISHLHADHHLGLINIIQHRYAAFRKAGIEGEPLVIVSTARLSNFLSYYHRKFECVLGGVELLKCEQLIYYNKRIGDTMEEDTSVQAQLVEPQVKARALAQMGLRELGTCKAIHCPHAFSVSITTAEGYKICYSGDTRPNGEFQILALREDQVPDLLIHEATMEHDMIYDAVIKKHSTFTEAINEGMNMNAKFTLLTHFSQRYSKMPLLDEIKDKPNVGIAFDMMTLNPENLKFIPSIYPALEKFLWDFVEDLRDRSSEYKIKNTAGGRIKSHVDLDMMTPLDEKKRLADKLIKRHEEKQAYFQKLKRKQLQKQEDSKKSKVTKLS